MMIYPSSQQSSIQQANPEFWFPFNLPARTPPHWIRSWAEPQRLRLEPGLALTWTRSPWRPDAPEPAPRLIHGEGQILEPGASEQDRRNDNTLNIAMFTIEKAGNYWFSPGPLPEPWSAAAYQPRPGRWINVMGVEPSLERESRICTYSEPGLHLIGPMLLIQAPIVRYAIRHAGWGPGEIRVWLAEVENGKIHQLYAGRGTGEQIGVVPAPPGATLLGMIKSRVHWQTMATPAL